MTTACIEPPKLDAWAKSTALDRARASAQNLKQLVDGGVSMFGSVELAALLETHDAIVADLKKIESLEDRVQLAHKDLSAKVERLAEMLRLLETSDPNNPPELLRPKATAEIQKKFRRKWLEATSAVKKSIPDYLKDALRRSGFKIVSANVDDHYEHLTIEIRRKTEQKPPVIEDVESYFAATVQMATGWGNRQDIISNLELFEAIAKEPMLQKSIDLLLDAIRELIEAESNRAASTAHDTS